MKFSTNWCRNNKWAFLEGVRNSGAPPPRQVIVQQCIRDKGLLESLCNYVCDLIAANHLLLYTVECVYECFFLSFCFQGVADKRVPAFKTSNLLLYCSCCGGPRCDS